MHSVSRKIAVVAISLLINSMPCALAQDGTPTTTPSVGKPSDSDFLKDIENEVTPTTAVGPITPAVTPVKPAPVARPTAASQKPIVLKGRLEEVSGNGANLPVGLLLGLKSQKAKLAPVAQPKADPLKGLVASFPTDWAGQWGGSLSIWWTQIDPSYWQWDPENAKETAEVLKRGASGTTTFNFYQNGNAVLVQPARVTFPPRMDQTTQQLPANNAFSQMFGAAGTQMMQALNTKIPVMILGDYQGQGIGANQLNLRVVKNDIKQLKPGLLEQDIITQETERKASGELKNSYSETVIRFTKQNASQLYVQAASIKYRNDGHFLDKVIFYGTVTRGQVMPDAANPFAGMPGAGSFPGMPTSPSGGAGGMPGLDGLNQLIKQMQNGLQ